MKPFEEVKPATLPRCIDRENVERLIRYLVYVGCCGEFSAALDLIANEHSGNETDDDLIAGEYADRLWQAGQLR